MFLIWQNLSLAFSVTRDKIGMILQTFHDFKKTHLVGVCRYLLPGLVTKFQGHMHVIWLSETR